MVDRDPDIESRVIRIFPGYAGSVLWAWFGVVEYGESRLSTGLITALREWETLGEREVATGQAMTEAEEHAWSAEGGRLAAALADELGSGFSIEMRRGLSPVLVNSQRPPTNPSAASFFESSRIASVNEHVDSERRLAALTPEERASFRYAPISDPDFGQT